MTNEQVRRALKEADMPSKPELQQQLRDRGIDYSEADTKDDLQYRLDKADVDGPDSDTPDIPEGAPVASGTMDDQGNVGVDEVADDQAGQGSSDADPEDVAAAEAGNEQVQEKQDEVDDQGFFGTNPDPTPNHNYTLQGQAEGAPVPEADPDQFREVLEHQAGDQVEQRFPNKDVDNQ